MYIYKAEGYSAIVCDVMVAIALDDRLVFCLLLNVILTCDIFMICI